MSREILAFMLFAAAGLGLITTHWHASFSTSSWMLATSALGLVSVFCSGMIYVDTHRPAWIANNTFTRFFGTTLLLGATGTTTILSWIGASASNSGLRQSILWAGVVTIFLRTVLFIWERQMSSHTTRYYQVPCLFRLQSGFFVLATSFGVLALFNHGFVAAFLATSSFLVTFTSRILERYEFFVTGAAPKMPGTVAS
jgi:DMSO reductase anchor subunit